MRTYFPMTILKLYLCLQLPDDQWKDLAKYHFNETEESCMKNLKQFYVNLKSLQDKNEDQCYTRLLQNLPLSNLEHSKSIYGDLLNENSLYNHEDGTESCTSISRYLLKFLRGGNHDIEGATNLLIVYLQMMKNHPNYYDGLTHQGQFTSMKQITILILLCFNY